MKEIKLTQGYVALVDDEDYERVSQHKWHTDVQYKKDGTVKIVYARTNTENKPRLHRFVLGITSPEVFIDHQDNNGLNCQKENLRKSTNSQNQMNSRMHNTSGYKGVCWDESRTNGRNWVVRLKVNGKQKHVGYFKECAEAARAYDSAALIHYGDFAKTNEMLGLFSEEEKCLITS